MSTIGLVDPELRDALALWPLQPLTADSLTQRRASLLKVIGVVPKPDLPDITADETRVESAFGAKPIRVLTYRPVKSEKPLPTIMHIHGGGFVAGAPDAQLAGDLIKCRAADITASRKKNPAILRIELIDCGASPHRVALSEDLLEIAQKQPFDDIRHDVRSGCALARRLQRRGPPQQIVNHRLRRRLELCESRIYIAALEMRPEGRGRDVDGETDGSELKLYRRLAELLNATCAPRAAIAHESDRLAPPFWINPVDCVLEHRRRAVVIFRCDDDEAV
jgi:hypothetical protein